MLSTRALVCGRGTSLTASDWMHNAQHLYAQQEPVRFLCDQSALPGESVDNSNSVKSRLSHLFDFLLAKTKFLPPECLCSLSWLSTSWNSSMKCRYYPLGSVDFDKFKRGDPPHKHVTGMTTVLLYRMYLTADILVAHGLVAGLHLNCWHSDRKCTAFQTTY
jgi:hypothetical protein